MGLDVGEVGHPQPIRGGSPELPSDQVAWPVARLIADRCPDARLASHHATEAKLPHEPLDRAAGDRRALPVELRPDFVGAVHLPMLVPDALNHLLQDLVPLPAS
jgi:hypothetical protein